MVVDSINTDLLLQVSRTDLLLQVARSPAAGAAPKAGSLPTFNGKVWAALHHQATVPRERASWWASTLKVQVVLWCEPGRVRTRQLLQTDSDSVAVDLLRRSPRTCSCMLN